MQNSNLPFFIILFLRIQMCFLLSIVAKETIKSLHLVYQNHSSVAIQTLVLEMAKHTFVTPSSESRSILSIVSHQFNRSQMVLLTRK